MSAILFLRYWQKQCSNSFVLYCFQQRQIHHNSVTRYPIVWIKMKHIKVMRKWCKKIATEIFDKRLISLDHVTYRCMGILNPITKVNPDQIVLNNCLYYGRNEIIIQLNVNNDRYMLYILSIQNKMSDCFIQIAHSKSRIYFCYGL